MPLTAKGKKIMGAMKGYYGAGKGKKVFYASENKGTITGVKRGTMAMAKSAAKRRRK